MPSKRDIVEGVLFLPGMVLVAAAVLAGMMAIITAGWYTAHGWYWIARVGLGFPRALALTCTTMATPLTIYAALRWIGRRI